MPISSQKLDQKILSLIQKGMNQPCSDQAFNKIALEIFEYQFLNNIPYQQYCKTIKQLPSEVSHWKKIPAIPVSAFKEASLACFPIKKAKKVFHTSGTTRQKKGHHYLENLNLYEASLLINFKNTFGIKKERCPILILTPSPTEMPHSSLVHMMKTLKKEIGTKESHYFIQNGKFLIDDFKKALAQLCKKNEPLLILGTAFSFVHFLDHAVQKRWKIVLPPESRIMETGGYKGKSRELPKKELYKRLETTLGIPRTQIINEYGMTEMGSQFYDHPDSFHKKSSRYKTIPPWVRTRVLNPLTLKEVKTGETGILQHFDLTNRSSVIALLTEDLGIKIENGFEILSRAPQAEPRGCSIGIDDWMKKKSK